EDPRDRCGGRQYLERRSLREQNLASGAEVEGDDVKRDRGVGHVCELDVAGQEVTQAAIGHEVVATPGETYEQCSQAEREDLLTSELVPHLGELVRRVGSLWARGHECRVQSAGGGGDEEIGEDA